MKASGWLMGLCMALAVLSMGMPATAQETVHFRQQFQAGDTIEFNQQSDVQMSFDIRANGQVLQQVQQAISNTRVGRMELLEVADGKPTRIRVSYAPTSGGRMEAMGQRQEMPFGAAGQTVTISKQNGMTVIDHDGNLDDAAQQELMGLLDVEEPLFPNRPLRVGETFDIDGKALSEAFEFDAQKVIARATVLGVREANGRRQAQVRLEVEIDAIVEGVMKVGMKLLGDAWFDEQTSRPINSSIKGPMTIAGQVSEPMQPGGPAVPMQIAGGGQVSYVERSTFSAGRPAPVDGPVEQLDNQIGGDAAIPGFGPGPGGVSDQINQGAPNPFELAADNHTFGRFSGDGMELDIQPNGGSIRMGNVVAKISVLNQDPQTGSGSGKFEMENGGTFDFTIERTGPDTVNFKTGRSSYKLQRVAPPAPANPFDQ